MTADVRIVSTEPTYPTSPYPYGLPPEWAIIREIDFFEDGDTLRIFFSRYHKNVKVINFGNIDNLLALVAGNWDWTYDSPSHPVEPYSSALSLGNEELSYVIYKLASRSWQFAKTGEPIRIGNLGHDADAYYDAHCVNPQGQVDIGTDHLDGCMVAYMIADGPKAKDHAGGDGTYAHAINLYVDLVIEGTAPPKYMPIIIDPDVRYPGGSQ